MEFLQLFVGPEELSAAELGEVVATSFAGFGTREVVRLEPLGTGLAGGGAELAVLELWHGPTLAFKDLGMQVLVNFLKFFLGRRNERITLLVGTSGDTGSSAIEAVRSSPNIDIVVLFPCGGRISSVQERQMTTVAAVEENVYCVGVEGTSDDLDVPMEEVFADLAFKSEHKLGSINSVNICRVLVQVVHYFYAYLRLHPRADPGQRVAFSVPTGAAGHITAGLMARAMGLPVSTLCAATNANDVLHRVLSAPLHRPLDLSVRGVAVQVTNSPSMDIQVPYNIERMLFIATGGDSEFVRRTIRRFKAEGRLELATEVRDALHDLGMWSSAVSNQRVLSTIAHVAEVRGYVLDPHTAVGVSAVRGEAPGAAGGGGGPHVVCMACAHPAKFMDTVVGALGVPMAEADDRVRQATPAHPHVRRVLDLQREVTRHREVTGGAVLPSIGLCHTLEDADKLRKDGAGTAWAQQVRRIIAGVTAKHMAASL